MGGKILFQDANNKHTVSERTASSVRLNKMISWVASISVHGAIVCPFWPTYSFIGSISWPHV